MEVLNQSVMHGFFSDIFWKLFKLKVSKPFWQRMKIAIIEREDEQ
jgi:hypothetical protein